MNDTVRANKQVVVDFHDRLRDGDLGGIADAFATEWTDHTGAGAVQRTAANLALGAQSLLALGPTTRAQREVFGEGDRVAWISTFTRGGQDFSVVVVYRLAGGKIVERWPGATAAVRWAWEPVAVAGDTDATRAVHRRWYEEMYGQGRYLELAPQLCGPVFLRHEPTGTFSATAEEHAARLHQGMQGRPVVMNYDVVAEGRMVAVVGTYQGGAWTQAWRVADGKLVESWWAGNLSPGA